MAQSRFQFKVVTIPAGKSLSNVVDCSAGEPVFLHLPLDWTSARLTFQVSPDGTTFYDLFDTSARELTFNVLPGTALRLDSIWEPVINLKVRSGGRDAPVNQGFDRVLTLTIDTKAQSL